MSPTWTANGPLKHTNPQLYIGTTEVRSRALCDAGALLGSKIHPVGSFLVQNNWQNLLFQQHSGQKAVLMCSNALHNDFIAHMVLKSWNHSFSHSKTNNSWWSGVPFGTENGGTVE